MRRLHNSTQKKIEFREPDWSSPYGLSYFKPRGLWYGMEDSWVNWCKGEMPDWIKPHFHEITVDPSKLLIIRSAKAFIEFHEKYKIENEAYPWLRGIDWDRIRKEYSGIEISKYFWQFRLEFWCHWYYGWDVASGCIWRADAIKSIRRLRYYGKARKSPTGKILDQEERQCESAGLASLSAEESSGVPEHGNEQKAGV